VPKTAYTYVSPPSNDVVDVVLADREADDAAVDGLAAVLRVEFLLLHLDPAQRTHREPYRITATQVVQVRAAWTRRLVRAPSPPATAHRLHSFTHSLITAPHG